MAALSTPGLDRWQRTQQRPFGTNTNMSAPTPAQTDYRRQVQDYGQALRTLRRASRKGDPEAALGVLKVADMARERGVMGVQGIRRAEDQQVAAQQFEANLGAMATDRERAADVGAMAAPATPRLDAGAQTPRLDAGAQTPRLDAGAQTPRLDAGAQTPRLDARQEAMRTPPSVTGSVGESMRPRLGAGNTGFDASGIDLQGEVVETAQGPLAQARRQFAQSIDSNAFGGDFSKIASEAARLGISANALLRYMGEDEVEGGDQAATSLLKQPEKSDTQPPANTGEASPARLSRPSTVEPVSYIGSQAAPRLGASRSLPVAPTRGRAPIGGAAEPPTRMPDYQAENMGSPGDIFGTQSGNAGDYIERVRIKDPSVAKTNRLKKQQTWEEKSKAGENVPKWLRGSIAGKALQLIQRPSI